jgi:transposase
MLQPLVRRTWAPRGQTPVMYCWDRHDRLSVLAGLSLAPRYTRVGLYFAVHHQNITAEELAAFLRQVTRHLRRSLIVVLDRWSVHRKAARFLQDDRRFAFEWLPSYAPDLNPVEHVWNHTKYADLANYVPENVVELECSANCSLQDTRQTPKLLRSFFYAADLKL